LSPSLTATQGIRVSLFRTLTFIVDLMHGHGFGTYSYDPLNRILSPLGGKNSASGNTLFVRDVAFVEHRLRGAPRVAVAGRRI